MPPPPFTNTHKHATDERTSHFIILLIFDYSSFHFFLFNLYEEFFFNF